MCSGPGRVVGCIRRTSSPPPRIKHPPKKYGKESDQPSSEMPNTGPKMRASAERLWPVPSTAPCSSAPADCDSSDCRDGFTDENPMTTTGRMAQSCAGGSTPRLVSPIRPKPSVISSTPASRHPLLANPWQQSSNQHSLPKRQHKPHVCVQQVVTAIAVAEMLSQQRECAFELGKAKCRDEDRSQYQPETWTREMPQDGRRPKATVTSR
jgi:hypothetical protein